MSVAVCGFCSVSLSVFAAKIKSGFRICYSAMRFGVFPVSLRKIRASTTSTACTSSRILLAVSVLIKICFGFTLFFHFFARFCDF